MWDEGAGVAGSVVDAAGGAAGQGPEEYPWEPPAEWDPGDLTPAGGQPPAPTWVAKPADQVGWNTGHDTGAGYPPPPGQQTPPPAWGAQVPPGYPPASPPPRSGGSRKPLIIAVVAVVVIAAIVAGVLVAVGGGKKSTALNGVQNQSGTDALTSARAALRAASSAELSGTVLDAGQPIRLDLTLAGNNSQGTLTISNNDVQLIKVDQSVFIKGDMDFLKKYAGNNPAVLNQLNGKWLETPTTTDFDLFTLAGFADLLKGGTGSATVNPKVTQSTLNGQKVVVVSQSDGSTLDIANTGPAVPLLLNAKGNDGGQLTFANYNKPVTITAPPASEVLDLSNTTPTASPTPPDPQPRCTASTPARQRRRAGHAHLLADNSYTREQRRTSGSWGSSGDQVAFAGGALDKYAATLERHRHADPERAVHEHRHHFTCVKQ